MFLRVYKRFKFCKQLSVALTIFDKVKISILICSLLFSGGASAENYSWKFSFIERSYSSAETACKDSINFYYDINYFNVPDGYDYYLKHDRTSYQQWWPMARCMIGMYELPGGRRVGEVTPIAVRSGEHCSNNSIAVQETLDCIYAGSPSQIGSPANSTVADEAKACAANPINFATGNKYQNELDYQGGGAGSLQFSRTYNSADGVWRHNYSDNIVITTNSITLVAADGREAVFNLQGETATATLAGLGRLQKIADKWVYTSQENESFTFDTQGRLIKKTSPTDLAQELTYTADQVVVTNNFGHSMSFVEDIEHQPLSLTAGEHSVVYTYNDVRRLVEVKRTSPGVTEQRNFHYEDNRNNYLLTGITDERGVRYATWAYDDKGRAISSSHAGGTEFIEISYNTDGSSTVTNELGKNTTYEFQTIDGFKHITAINGEPSANCPNSNSIFTYDERGLLKTKTDNKGNLTTYDYNARGLEVSRTEAAGTPQARTITTDWHPTLFRPVTVSEPTRITTYTYDAQGRQLSQSVTQR